MYSRTISSYDANLPFEEFISKLKEMKVEIKEELKKNHKNIKEFQFEVDLCLDYGYYEGEESAELKVIAVPKKKVKWKN